MDKREIDFMMEYVPDLKKFFLRKEKVPHTWTTLKAVIAPEHWCY